MRHPEIEFMALEQQRNEALAEADNHRLVKEAQMGARLQAGLQTPVQRRRFSGVLMLILASGLSLIGGALLSWSCRLHYQYELLLTDVMTDQTPTPCA
jgi:hypothetical protein